MRIATTMLGALALSALQALPAAGQSLDRKAIGLADARRMAAAAEAEARRNNWTMVIAICDEGGNLIYLEKLDDTQIGSIEIAQGKAATAARMKRPTKALEDAIAGGRNAVLGLPGITPVEGGLPVVVDGRVIGAIGVSGGTSAQDGQVAQAGLDAAGLKK